MPPVYITDDIIILLSIIIYWLNTAGVDQFLLINDSYLVYSSKVDVIRTSRINIIIKQLYKNNKIIIAFYTVDLEKKHLICSKIDLYLVINNFNNYRLHL